MGLATLLVNVALLLLVATSRPAAAHEHLTVGPYGLTVGWRVEPPIVGVLNGLDLGINYTSNGTVVVGVQNELTATLSYGSYSVTRALEAQEGRDGWYTFDVIPTRNGTYSVRLVGALNGTSVDVSVTLQDVMSRSTVEFPIPDPTVSDLQSTLASLSAQNAALQAQVSTALLVAGIGGVLGFAGALSGVVAARRSRPPK